MGITCCSLLGYLIGTINPSYLIGRVRGFDIRHRGSGNAGASNAIITMGVIPGVIIMLLDIWKAILAVTLMGKLFSGVLLAKEIAGTACVLGHIFPFYMGFKGGKGLACLGGVIAAFNWKLFLLLFAIAVLISYITDYICFIPILGSLLFPLIYGISTGNWLGAAVYCILPVVMFYKHTENLRRIRNGTEARFSYLWNKEEEVERLKRNSGGQ